ncbi:MAG: glutamine--fructose-6-phosphate transaminase (isomerizing) [Methanomassiliicoccales archaeon]
MCGIIGYAGGRRAEEVILDGLKRLEYRGYDSAGLAVRGNGIQVHKAKGEIDGLRLSNPGLEGESGVGHTRWATCGKPSKVNAHPFLDCTGSIALVHNGIIENHYSLRSELEAEGHRFTSETDTEVLVHLMERYHEGDLHSSLTKALREVKGTYAIAAIDWDSEEIVAARKENPLVIGLGVGENFVASDVTPLLNYTTKVIYLMDGDTAVVRADGVNIYDHTGQEVHRPPSQVNWSVEDAQKGGFEHFMLKEIFEQPRALHDTIVGSLSRLEEGDLLADPRPDSVKLIACGTSYHAGMVGKYLVEELTRLPVTVELASEYRYSSGVSECPLVMVISQSGETADALAALREAKRRGCPTLAVTNVVGSTLTREAEEVLYTQAGPEIGVAATKTFLTQLVSMFPIAMQLGSNNRALHPDDMRTLKREIRSLPFYVQSVLDRADEIGAAAEMFDRARDAFFIGRNINYPTVLEGALKMKEISYLHAEGYAAGELKHGPLALVGPHTPTVAACVRDHTYDKMMSNISEVVAREAPVLALGFEGDRELPQLADRVLEVPEVHPLMTPIPISVVLQLLAYQVAKRRGCPIDKPRNLAKSVTVE